MTKQSRYLCVLICPPPPFYQNKAKIQDCLVYTWHVKILSVPYSIHVMKISKIFPPKPQNRLCSQEEFRKGQDLALKYRIICGGQFIPLGQTHIHWISRIDNVKSYIYKEEESEQLWLQDCSTGFKMQTYLFRIPNHNWMVILMAAI